MEYINDYEIKTGQKSELNRKVTAEEAAQNSEVQKIIKPHILFKTHVLFHKFQLERWFFNSLQVYKSLMS